MFKTIRSCKRGVDAAAAGLALAGCALLPLHAFAQNPQNAPDTSPVQSSDDLSVVRDAESGKLRAPTPEEHNAMRERRAEALRARRIAPASTQPKWHRSGATGARLTDEFMSSSVVVRNADGSLTEQCVETPEAAAAAMKPAARSAAKTAIKFETE